MNKNFWQKLNRPILALAPMAGITDSAYREICRRYGADVVYSEMASVSALFFKPEKTLELVKFNANERPYVVQLFGKDPAHFAKATKIISDKIKPDGIDINFGCPAKKVFGHGSGCALMPQCELAREIISAVCENTNLPVSIKIRAGLKNITATEFIENTKDLPYSAVMIHGRTYEGGFSGKVDFGLCEEIKKIIPEKIILGNGGVILPEDGVRILHDHPLLDGLGIARGAWGRPWIFEEIKALLHCVETNYDFARIKQIMLEHAALIYADKGDTGKFEMRKHLAWYVKGFPGAAELRRKLVLAESLGEIEKMPITANRADVVVSNCVLNLVPDKRKAFSEIFRILKKGGHFSISDVVLFGELPKGLQQNAEMYAGCVSGAIQKEEYLSIIREAGFENVIVQKEKAVSVPDEILKNFMSENEISEYKKGTFGIFSITVYAEKSKECCGPNCCN